MSGNRPPCPTEINWRVNEYIVTLNEDGVNLTCPSRRCTLEQADLRELLKCIDAAFSVQPNNALAPRPSSIEEIRRLGSRDFVKWQAKKAAEAIMSAGGFEEE